MSFGDISCHMSTISPGVLEAACHYILRIFRHQPMQNSPADSLLGLSVCLLGPGT